MTRQEGKQLQPGDAVHYDNGYGELENGIVKYVPSYLEDSAFVVYHCSNDWGNYKEYTAARTNFKDLNKGWVG